MGEKGGIFGKSELGSFSISTTITYDFFRLFLNYKILYYLGVVCGWLLLLTHIPIEWVIQVYKKDERAGLVSFDSCAVV